MAEGEIKFLSQLGFCFSWPHNSDPVGVPRPLGQPVGKPLPQGLTRDHIFPHEAFKQHHTVLEQVIEKPFNQAIVCWPHHEALEVCKREMFKAHGLLGVSYFLVTDYPRPREDEPELQAIFVSQFGKLYKAVLDQVKSAQRKGPTGKITKTRMANYPQTARVLEAGLDHLNSGNLVVPTHEIAKELDLAA